MNKSARILATIGPATQSISQLTKLVKAGMNAVRINFSHNNYDFHKKTIENVRFVEKKLKIFIPILADLQGPKIRVSNLISDIKIKKKQKVYLYSDKVKIKLIKNKTFIPISYDTLIKDVKPKERLLINDGLITLKVIQKTTKTVECIVEQAGGGGIVSSHKGLNLPDTNIKQPALTKKDLNDLKFIVANDLDYIALSFVRYEKDITLLKKYLKQYSSNIPIISKIEKPEALKNIDSIINISDGIMVARGDLGVELPLIELPLIQKKLIKKANAKGKLVITATQMLESMINNPVPTRAEVSDVGNAILDGTDVVMLSAETAIGKFPEMTVNIMSKIIQDIEKHSLEQYKDSDIILNKIDVTNAITHSACVCAYDTNSVGISVFTHSGYSALLTSKHKPIGKKIYAVTIIPQTARRTALYWGTIPVLCNEIYSLDNMFDEVRDLLLKNKLVKKNDNIIITAGAPLNSSGTTNLLKLQKI